MYGRCDPCLHEDPGQVEARTGPGPLCPRNGKRPHTIQGTCDDTACWPPQRPADGQQRAALRLRVSLKSTSAHQCPACACGQKSTSRTPRWRSSRASAPQKKDQSGSAADWRSPRNDSVSLRPPPVCTGRGGRWLRKEWEPPTLLAALSISTCQSWCLLDGLLPLRRRAIASAGSLQSRTSRRVLSSGPELRERCRVQLTCQK